MSALPRRAAAALLSLGLALPLLAFAPADRAAAADTPPPCPAESDRPWCDTALSPDERARLFVEAMTLDERIQLLGGQGTTNNGIVPGGHTGATYAVPRLGLPVVFLSDGPVGPRQGLATAMPIPHALAATFSDEFLAGLYGAEIADEAKHKGNDVLLAPIVNLARQPQAGRTYEAYGEDSFLSGRIGAAFVRGAQQQGVIATIKHFAANNQEGQIGAPPLTSVQGGRTMVNATIDQRTLREVYLPQFEAAVKQGEVGTVMCAYNKVNGGWACQNPTLLKQILREEWGFRNLVMSDYAAASHNQPDDTARNLNNGLDFVPAEGSLDRTYNPVMIRAALATGQVTEATITEHAFRIVRTLFDFGFFDRAGYAEDESRIDVRAHEDLAQRVEERAITLLENDGVLPLRPDVKSIAVIGPYADLFVTGGGSGGVKPRSFVTALQGITARAGEGVTVTSSDGSDPAAAAALAAAADVAVLVVGDVQSEGTDKTCLDLNCTSDLAVSNSILLTTGPRNCVETRCPLNGLDQKALIDAVAAVQEDTVVVLESGGPVLTPWRDDVAALVQAWYPGQRGGAAIARVLFGDVDPGGRLPSTFPASADQLPTAGDPESYPGVLNEVEYKEGLLVGHRWYDAKGLEPAYPFGAGLSYTTFRYGPLTVQAAQGPNQVAVASMDVTNTGRRDGIAVPQLYVSKPATADLPQPVRQLAGHHSVAVPAGQTVRVSFPLNDRSFASWTEQGWAITPGCYGLAAGASSRDLPSRTAFGRGADCPGGAPRLEAAGDFRLPLPETATSRLLPGGGTAADAPTGPQSPRAARGTLPATGPSSTLPLLGLLVLGLAFRVRGSSGMRRVHSS